MKLKQKTHELYKQLVQDKIDVFQDMIAVLSEDSKNDAKGSAGDKHETALSMMHLEQEKLNYKLAENIHLQTVLDKIDSLSQHKVVGVGSLVQTNHLLVFISVALPKIVIDNHSVFAISPQSPLGVLLMGKRVGEEFTLNKTKYIIESID